MFPALLLAALLAATPLGAQTLPDYAAGAREVLDHAPDLPAETETRGALDEILARPEFKGKDARPPGPSLYERIIDWILRHLPSGLGNIEGAGRTAAVIAAVIIAALLVLLVYVVVRATWTRLSEKSAAKDPVDEDQLDAASLLQLAHKAATAGDYRAALRYRFKAVVSALGELNSERRTNWQLLRHVRREHPAAVTDFAALVGLFEDCWYGGQPAGAEEYARARQLAQAIEEKVMPREEAA